MMMCTRLLAAAVMCLGAGAEALAHAGCPELNRLPANVPDGQLSCTGGVSPFGARAADDFFLPLGTGAAYSVRSIRAVMIANYPLTPTTVGLTFFDDATTGSPPRPVPGRIAGGTPNLLPTVTDIGAFGATAPDGRPFRYYEVIYALPVGALQLPRGAWYWVTPYALAAPAGAQTDIAYAALRSAPGLVREPVNKSTAMAPGAFIMWESTADCCLGGSYDLALFLDAEQPGALTIDFDCDGVLSVDDIFAFLNAWFASAPEADFNGSGGLSAQDIFDYLNAWFAGA